MTDPTSAAIEIGPIIFGPEKFKVQGTLIAYEEVKHLSWYWFSQTINLVNTQNAKLSIFLRSSGKEIKLSKHTMWVSPKLAQTYETLREKTWAHRLRPYIEQLEIKGSFQYQGCEFFSDGSIRSGNDVFQLSKASTEPFQLSIKRDGFFSRRLTVALNLDHDIIHTLISRFSEAPEAPARFVARAQIEREEREAAHHWFFDTIRLCATMAAIDGRIDPDEVLVVKEFVRVGFELEEAMLRKAISLFNSARESSRPGSYYAQRLARFHGTNRKLMVAILNLVRDVALSDGELDRNEEKLLGEIAQIFGIAGNADSFRKDPQDHTSPLPGDPEEARHGRVLNLKGRVTIEVIRQSYRRLVLQHHPDKHYHSSAADQRAAHERIVEINLAYAFFRRRYGF